MNLTNALNVLGPSGDEVAAEGTGQGDAVPGAEPVTARSDAGDDGATGAPAGPRRADAPEAAPIDPVDTAGASVAKVLVPAGIVALVVIWLLRRRRG